MICECESSSYRWFIMDVCFHRRSELRKPLKALGDPPAHITSQSMATYAHDFSATSLETFVTLAKTYIFEGRDRTDICTYNSQV